MNEAPQDLTDKIWKISDDDERHNPRFDRWIFEKNSDGDERA